MDEILSRLPEEFQKDIYSATEILKNAGYKEIYIFGCWLRVLTEKTQI